MSTLDEQYGGDHYKKMAVQPWEVVDGWPLAQQIGFYRGNALKYLMRAGAKDDPLQEIKKARHYLDRLIEVLGDNHDSRVTETSSMAASTFQVYADPFGGEPDGPRGSSHGGLVPSEQDPQGYAQPRPKGTP